MNFDHMPELHTRYGYFACIAVMALFAAEILGRDVDRPRVVEGSADRGDLAVHHPRWGAHVGPGVGLRDRGLAVDLEGGVVVDRALGGDQAAVAVVGVLVEAEVGHQHEVVAHLVAAEHDSPFTRGIARNRAGRRVQQHPRAVAGNGPGVDPGDRAKPGRGGADLLGGVLKNFPDLAKLIH